MLKNRIHSLDYLRGIMALMIMLYHFSAWLLGDFDSSNFMGRIGVYGVAIFYILSGITLFTVYKNSDFTNISVLVSFFVKRIFRIFPVLWIATLFSVWLKHQYNWKLILINLTGLFGLIKPTAYIATGAWSIGNELTFYLCFPFFIYFSRSNKVIFYVLCFISLLTGLYFTFLKIDPVASGEANWAYIINPLNQILLFTGGILLGFLFNQENGTVINRQWLLLIALMMSLIGFIYYPLSGDRVLLNYGLNRLFFITLSFIICFCIYIYQIELQKHLHKVLLFLGEVSYALYLLHPVIFTLTKRYIIDPLNLSNELHFLLSFLFTLIISYLVYIFIEKPMMRAGKIVADKTRSFIPDKPKAIVGQ